jgi:hypothetical protein
MDNLLQDILQILAVFGMCMLKYIVGLIIAFKFNYGFFPTVLLSVAGGMTGFYVFAIFEKTLERFFRRFRKKKDPNKIKISRFMRWLVRIRSGYGIAGIALLTPILLQVPIGTLIAIRLTHNFHKVSLYMLASFTFTSSVLCGLYYGFRDHFEKLVQYLPFH